MRAAELRTDLLNKIESLNAHQLKEFYGLFQNYINGKGSEEDWNTLTLQQKEKIERGIKQANTGVTKPLTEVTSRLRKKYGFNG